MDLKRFLLTLAPVAAAVVVGGCSDNWPYGPEQQSQPSSTTVNEGLGYSLHYGNAGKQICNPSASQDVVNYPNSMLWLGFSSLNVKSAPPEYDQANVRQHDRLTISDTGDVVRWFMMNTDLGLSGNDQIQDPEWSTAPNYIACLGQASDLMYEAYATRISDKAYLKLTTGEFMDETSTPHIWVSPAATDVIFAGEMVDPSTVTYNQNGLADTASVKKFFGTKHVKLVYNKMESGSFNLYFVDFAAPGGPEPVLLQKPADRSEWAVESPLFSPDGNWITYNAAQSIRGDVWECYAQQVSASAEPRMVAADGAAPHWFVDPSGDGTLYIVYAKINGIYQVKSDLTPAFEESGQLGATYMQEVIVSSGNVPSFLEFRTVGEPTKILGLPFKGGITPDGRVLATGYSWLTMAYMK